MLTRCAEYFLCDTSPLSQTVSQYQCITNKYLEQFPLKSILRKSLLHFTVPQWNTNDKQSYHHLLTWWKVQKSKHYVNNSVQQEWSIECTNCCTKEQFSKREVHFVSGKVSNLFTGFTESFVLNPILRLKHTEQQSVKLSLKFALGQF